MTTPKTDNSNERESAAQMFKKTRLEEARAMLIEGEKEIRHVADHFLDKSNETRRSEKMRRIAQQNKEELTRALDAINKAKLLIKFVMGSEK